MDHRPSIILSLQRADESCYSAWACDMMTKELLQNPYDAKRQELTIVSTTNWVNFEWEDIQFIISCCSVDDPDNCQLCCINIYTEKLKFTSVIFLPRDNFHRNSSGKVKGGGAILRLLSYSFDALTGDRVSMYSCMHAG